MSWTYTDFKKWIASGCPQGVANTVRFLDLTNINLTTLPECIGQLVNLITLHLHNNKLTTLPDTFGKLAKLKELHLRNNKLTTLPDTFGQLVNLKCLYLHDNNFSTLPECIGQLVNLTMLSLNRNNLTALPESFGQLVNLTFLDLEHNNLTTLPESFGQLVNLTSLDLEHNNFSSLPPVLGNLRRLRHFYYNNNPIDHIPANVLRMINRTDTVQGVYTDAQSVHNSAIQKSLLESVSRLLAIPLVFAEGDVMTQILEDPILTDESKARLVEYSEEKSVHTVLNLTFSEMLVVVWNRINTLESRDEIKKTLNTEILDAECKCFTGKISRLVNCMTGYDDLVVVEIADKEQIGTVIEIVRTRLAENYTVEEHRRICILELLERGYSREVIDEWVEHIE
jgi:F0F1-type ATP synthase delta subunit